MPELPEVETVKRTLESLIIGKQIENVTVSLPRIIRKLAVDEFRRRLVGREIERIDRRGKFLKIVCNPWTLISHLRMEGKYRLVNKEEPIEKHTHVIFHFTDNTELRYKDVRQFGTMDLVPTGEEEKHPPLVTLGIEPFAKNFTSEWLKQNLRQRKAKLKSLLLNQTFIVGLGNIYVDEVLFQAKIHPERVASTLTEEEIDRLHFYIRKVLTEAIEAGGTSVRTYRNGKGEMGYFQVKLQVYGRKNQPCYRCGRLIERIVVAGRGTHLCTNCQQ